MIVMVDIKCNVCHEEYQVSFDHLKKVSNENDGYFPCIKCGSLSTDWKFGEYIK